MIQTTRKPTHNFQKDISNCGLTGFISTAGNLVEGSVIIKSISLMHDRGNGLGGGFAAYGIYPDFKEFFAFHLMYENGMALQLTEEYLERHFFVEHYEEIPTRRTPAIVHPPLFKRYFVKPLETPEYREAIDYQNMTDEDVVVRHVMAINNEIEGAFVVSSGKNMGAFKGVGYPEEIADFFRLEEYTGYIWTAHNRFPTNTPGWWGGAHPFTLLDWSIVHNGEISSYGINKRYLEMYGYVCTMLTDTEVVAYTLDLLIRKHGLTPELASLAMAAPFWDMIDGLPDDERQLLTAIRQVYGSALLNGPFAILFASNEGLIGLNDRVKLRPLVCATKDDFVYMASEEAAIREICPAPDKVWSPRGGEPVIVKMQPDVI
ncbi:glutamine amidotransferase family protein [Geobacter sulfurreducens subsp. ethanolicus]|uniref:class II glutamine amidotransferase n=1 Tax=Geobacter sulfurreducens TaxID=35554 RepID=UPI0025733C8C|nr:glutamine amidotransferase family protein [Geobacter sulfurreducens]BEH10773.1 glutamine amidotransferase family protein [Geobacter sulfurreducens subsp. ethanolicus]